MEKSTSTKAAALEYAARGWAVLPTKPGKKEPATVHGLKDATKDRQKIAAWYKVESRGVAIATGRRSGLVVIDVDTHGADGPGSLRAWEEIHGALPETLAQTTGSGGQQLIYTYDGPPLQNYTNAAAGIDFRGEGGYIVAPPSVHPNGNRYSWNNPGQDPAPAEGLVLDFIEDFRPSKRQEARSSRAYMFDDDYEPFSLPAEIGQGERVTTLVRYVASMRAAGTPPKFIKTAIEDANETRCTPPLTSEELEAQVLPAIRNLQAGEPRENTAPAQEAEDLVEILQKLKAAKRYEMSDKGTSKLYSDIYKARHRYCPQWRKWAYYDGERWGKDPDGLAARHDAKKLGDALMVYAPAAGLDDEQGTKYRKYAASLGSYRARMNIVNDAMDNNKLDASTLDADSMLLNVINGTLDLRADPELRPHNADDFIGKLAPVSYDPGARCRVWDKFLKDVMEGDEAKIRYLQKFAGLSLTGITTEETMLILYGETTRNGKSTFVETLGRLLGDYAATMDTATLAKRDRDSRHASGDLARLAGIRYVATSEPPKGMPFDSARVKTMLGRDTITARNLYESEIQFVPMFKIIMNTNYLPQIGDDTIFSSGRVNIVTFNRHFEPEEQDKTLKDRLADPRELSGILNWCLEGLRLYRAEGLMAPETVKAATAQYRQESDKAGNFIAECLVESTKNTAASAAYASYKTWCRNSGYYAEGRRTFYEYLRTHNLLSKTGTVDGRTLYNVIPGYELTDEYEL